ncbi:MAG: glycerol-3-phosphate dehydrogenase [Hyphomonadaceae bacterium]|nr:MAG: anaerobic glycerol-3-phosphate dehydrogenase subunit C [Caulobacteraceae bacterium]MBT9446636.1 glycerol-3-phosphate dehydrogenase [Hyphomonadaceae bacterium]
MTSTPADPRREGSLEAPTRHPLEWRTDAFYDFEAIEKEMERVFDICHGCRRCFNLCDSFPRLFDLVDASSTGEVDGVAKSDYAQVVEGCTLCDMCYMTKCPYVPPHEWAVDFPHLMLRWRAAELKKNKGRQPLSAQLAETDRNGVIGRLAAPLANFASETSNAPARLAMEAVLGVDRHAILPKFHTRTFENKAALEPPKVNQEGPARGRKAVLYATCFVDYNEPKTGEAAQAVLARQGVETEVVYPACCGMPQLEHGDIAEVARRAVTVADAMVPWIEKGYDVLALTASCGLMMKFEWPLILPENENVRKLAAATRDICEYVVDISKREGLAPGLAPVDGGVTVHMACHARAQNMGQKSAEMLKLIPDTKVDVVERCSGHGGTFGVMKQTRPLAMKVGRPAAKQVAQKKNATVCSDCPLACKHLGQIVSEEYSDLSGGKIAEAHPIEVFARAYGLA